MEFVSPSTEDLATLEIALQQIDGIAAKYGYENILDKNKYREFQLSGLLGHQAFVQASGGKNNDDTYGADANDTDGNKCEYKTKTLTSREIRRFALKNEINFLGVYNGAYTHEAISRYQDIIHYFAAYVGTQPLAVIRVPTSEVISQLTYMLENSTKKTTNCNSVRLTGTLEQFDLVWKNDQLIEKLRDEMAEEIELATQRRRDGIRTPTPRTGPTKKNLAKALFEQMISEGAKRPKIIAAFIEQFQMTPSGASTYFYNFVSGRW